MKTILKKLILLSMTIALILGVCITSYAEEEGSSTTVTTSAQVTITGVKGEQTAIALKILNVESAAYNEAGNAITYAAYTLNEDLMGEDGLYEYLGFIQGYENILVDTSTEVDEYETDAEYETRIINYINTITSSSAQQEFTLQVALWLAQANTAQYSDDADAETKYTYWEYYKLTGNGTYTAAISSSTTESAVFNLEPGYYFFRGLGATYTGSDGCYGVLSVIAGLNTSLATKSTYPTVEKDIVTDEETSAISESTSASIGDTVTYQVKTAIPNMALYTDYHFVVEDIMTDGLTFTGIDSVIVYGSDGAVKESLEISKLVSKVNDNTDFSDDSILGNDMIYYYETTSDVNTYTVITYDYYNGAAESVPTFSLEIDDFYENYNGSYGDYIIITYTAMVNENATINGSNTNEAYVEYSTKPSDASIYDTSTPDITYVYVYDFDFLKVSASNTELPLEGAEFTLEKLVGEDYVDIYFDIDIDDEGNEIGGSYTVSEQVDDDASTKIITVSDGVIHIDGLGEGTYRLTEITAPAGYNKLDEPIVFSITALEDTSNPGEVVSVAYALISGSGGTTETSDTATVTHVKTEDIEDGVTSYLLDGDSVFVFTIKNVQGSLLPTTGGIGIILFSIVGVVAIVGGSYVMFYEPKRRRA